MNIKIANRRKFHRINLDGQVNLDFMNDSYDYCQIKNLSLTGMFVIGNFQQQQTEDCHINFFHKINHKEINLRASARVIWNNDEGIAFKFISMKLDSYMSLVTTLIHEADDPSAILQELPKNYPFEITSMQAISPQNNKSSRFKLLRNNLKKYYLACNKNNPESVQPVIDFIFSPEGRKQEENSNLKMIAVTPK